MLSLAIPLICALSIFCVRSASPKAKNFFSIWTIYAMAAWGLEGFASKWSAFPPWLYLALGSVAIPLIALDVIGILGALAAKGNTVLDLGAVNVPTRIVRITAFIAIAVCLFIISHRG